MNEWRKWSYVNTLAGIICDSGAASINDCHVFVELGITKPNSKNHSEEKTRNIKVKTKENHNNAITDYVN